MSCTPARVKCTPSVRSGSTPPHSVRVSVRAEEPVQVDEADLVGVAARVAALDGVQPAHPVLVVDDDRVLADAGLLLPGGMAR